VSIQLIRAKIAQHKAAEFLSPKGRTSDGELINTISWYISEKESPDYVAVLQKRLAWLNDLLRLQTELTDEIQAQERSDLE
jgi:hypothetical protein